MLKGPVPEGKQAEAIATQLRNWVANEVGPIAKPRDIRFGNNLPKTRSGKIMRRLLRVVAEGKEVTQDVSTLENPDVLKQFTGVFYIEAETVKREEEPRVVAGRDRKSVV